MSVSSVRLMIPPAVAAMVVFCLAPIVFAAPPEKADVVPPPPAPASLDSQSLSQTSRNSLTLTHDQTVIQGLELAREAVHRKDFLAALPLMERVLLETDSFVPVDASTELGAHEEVRRLMEQMPADLRQRLDEPRRVSARREWEQARKGGIAQVTTFLQQFGDLAVGVEALWWLGSYHRDHGQSQMAAAAFERVAMHSNATSQQRAIALMAYWQIQTDSHQTVAALSTRNQLIALDGDLIVGIQGRTLPLKQWLSEQSDEKEASSKAAIDPSSPSIAKDRLQRPIAQPVWKHSLTSAFSSNLTARESRQRDQGISPILLQRPLVVDQEVIVRTLDSVQAFDLASGDSRWTIPNVDTTQVGRPDSIDWAQRRMYADSIFNRMSTDGQRLFVIQDPDRRGDFGSNQDFARGWMRIGPRYNKLFAYSIDGGSVEWEIGAQPTATDQPFAGTVFFGCPFVLDDVLYVIAQRETEIKLLALEARRGSLIWSLTLGAALLPITEDLQRSRVACPIVWQQGLLLCSTSAGAVVAVDPLLRTMKWGYRYPATTITMGDLQQSPIPRETRLSTEPWWDSWREPFVSVYQPTTMAPDAGAQQTVAKASSSPILVFVSPETDRLHALQLPDGKLLWSVPREGGLFVAGMANDRVVVIEGNFVRAHDLATGEQLWRTTISEIGGAGAFVGPILVLSAQSGGTMLVDVRNGQLLSDSSSLDASLGALTPADDCWIASSWQNVMRLPRLADVRQSVEQELQSDPDNEALRLRAAFLDLQAGDTVAAIGRLDGLASSPARELRRQALIDALRDPDANRSGIDRSELARRLKELSEDVDYKFAVAATLGASALEAVDLVAVVDAALDGLSTDFDQPEGMVKMPSVIVRKDRVLLGLIDEAYRRAKPDELPALDQLFLNRLKDAKKSRDRQAVQRLAQQWRGLDWSRRLVVQEEEKTLRKRSLAESKLSAEIELQLLDAAGSYDTSIALQALDRLAQRLDRASDRREARGIRQRIEHELPLAKYPDGTTVKERLARDSQLQLVWNGPVKPMWPPVEPKVEPSRDDRTFGVYPLIPVHADPGSLAERLDIAVDRSNGTEVLFRGDQFFQAGQDEDHEQKYKLPSTVSPYRGSTGYMLREAWGIGKIVILLVGSELFGFSPLDSHGEPNPELIWSNPIDLQSSPGESRVVMNRGGANDGRYQVVDQSNHPIGRVGPVRAGYFCYQKGSKLVAAETDTGRTLWERLDLPADAAIVGDDHFIFLWRENKLLEVLSAIDGRKIEERVCEVSSANLIHQRGSLVWTVTQGTDVQLDLYDLRTNERVWSRSDPKQTQIAALDMETLGIATPDGQFHILAARTGTPVCDPVRLNQEIATGIVVWPDPERWIVALTRPPQNQAKRTSRAKDQYRLQFLTGTLFAVDRQVPRLLWQRELKNEPIALDQSRAAPVLVQLWKPPTMETHSADQALLRILDKRTGKVLIEKKDPKKLSTYFFLNPDPQQAILEIKLAYETMLLNYAPEDDASAK